MPKRLPVLFTAIGVAIVGGVAAVSFHGSSTGSGNDTSPTAFSLPALDGTGKVTLAQFRGHPTVVNFFASWCSTCNAELPNLVAEADALKGRVNFVGVDSLETGNKNAFVTKYDLTAHLTALASDVGGTQKDGLHAALKGGNRMPLTAFYDGNGKLLDVEQGALIPASTLKNAISSLYGIKT